MPLENSDPRIIPTDATAIIIYRGAAFEPMAELRKLEASLDTPTTSPVTARAARTARITVKRGSIFYFRFRCFPYTITRDFATDSITVSTLMYVPYKFAIAIITF